MFIEEDPDRANALILRAEAAECERDVLKEVAEQAGLSAKEWFGKAKAAERDAAKLLKERDALRERVRIMVEALLTVKKDLRGAYGVEKAKEAVREALASQNDSRSESNSTFGASTEEET